MQFHGNPIPAEDDPMFQWRIKSQGNEEARQQFLDGYVPQIRELGLTVPDPKLRKREDGVWEYSEPDWDELKQRRHRARAAHGRAARVPRALPRAGAVGARRSARRMIWEVFRQDRKGQPFEHARLGRGARRGVRRGVGARAVRPPRRVGRALARAARVGARRRRLGGRVRSQVPPRRRLLDQGSPEGGA